MGMRYTAILEKEPEPITFGVKVGAYYMGPLSGEAAGYGGAYGPGRAGDQGHAPAQIFLGRGERGLILLQRPELGGESVMGPYVLGLEHPVQIAPMTASASDLVMLAVLAAGDAHARQQRVNARV